MPRLSLWDYRCGMTSNSRAIPHRHLKKTCAYGRYRQTKHKGLGAAPKLAELVKVVLLVDPEIEIVGNHGEPKRRVQNAGNTQPCHGRHASDNPPVRSWFHRPAGLTPKENPAALPRGDGGSDPFVRKGDTEG